MQYAQFEMVEGLNLSPKDIGEQLEKELEQIGFKVTLPTTADWGYVFRSKSNGQNIDISILAIDGRKYKLAIEPEKGLIATIFNNTKSADIERVKAWVEELITTDIGAIQIKWYSANDWKATFGRDFWD